MQEHCNYAHFSVPQQIRLHVDGKRNLNVLIIEGCKCKYPVQFCCCAADYLTRASLRTQFHNDECSLHRRRELVMEGDGG